MIGRPILCTIFSMFLIITSWYTILYTPAEGIKNYSPQVTLGLEPEFLDGGTKVGVMANVTDIFGNIMKKHLLSYSYDYGTSWETVNMTLAWGFPSNGTYLATIPNPMDEYGRLVPTVGYNVTFEDELGYSYSSRIMNYSYPTTFDDTTHPEVWFNRTSIEGDVKVGENGVPSLTAGQDNYIRTYATDDLSGIKNITLFYYLEGNLTTSVLNDSIQATTNNIWKGAWLGIIDQTLPQNSTFAYFIRACDYAQNCNDIIRNNTLNKSTVNRYSFYISSIEKNEDTKIDVEILETDDELLNANLEINVNTNLSGACCHVEGIVVDEKDVAEDWPEFLLDIRNKSERARINGVEFSGDSSIYPFDSYTINILLAIPVKEAKTRASSPTFAEMVEASWETKNSRIEQVTSNSSIIKKVCLAKPGLIAFCEPKQSTFVNVFLKFERTAGTYLGIVFPVLAIFLLLGAILIFDSSPDYVGDRLTLTLGIFALIFTLPDIVNALKPTFAGITIADTLLGIIVVATIAYTIGSSISSYRINLATSSNRGEVPGRDKLKPIWSRIDKTAFVIVAIIVIANFVLNNYPIVLSLLLILFILLALGFGLMLQISGVRIRKPLFSTILGKRQNRVVS